MAVSFEVLKARLLENPEVKAAYEARAAEFEGSNFDSKHKPYPSRRIRTRPGSTTEK